jgi:serine/threonine protein kinase
MIGKTISHYQILEKLGEGGMGVVYKARDTHLGRLVAVKVLPPEKVADSERKRRFVQEAKAASALNHPNIITIHDIASENGIDFIVMEYVQGKTLDAVVPRKGLRLNETLKLSIQMADALAKAHSAGIIHRDLKPTNVMVTDDGLVKVLDFGLAKLTEASDSGDDRTLQSQTDEGTIVGTVSYMSPEQAEGKKVDARSDIFSFGSVLYEMATGQQAFHGDSKMSTLAAILNQEPKAISQLVPGIPRDLEKIIARCLRKDPNRRFQIMTDLKVTLEELKEESDSGTLTGTPPVARVARRSWIWMATAFAVIAIAVAGWLLRGTARKPQAASEVIPLTSYAGDEQSPSFSPDGNQVAFSWNGEKQDNTDIYVKLIGSPTPLRLTTDPADDLSPAFSPDGRFIGFFRVSKERATFVVIPSIGGPERIVADVPLPKSFLDLSFAWLPDSKWVVTDGLTLLSTATGEMRSLTSPPKKQYGDVTPAVSPDGHTISFSRRASFSVSEIYLLDLTEDLKAKGKPRQLTSLKTLSFGPAWTPEGREIIFTSGVFGHGYGLWKIPVSGAAEPEQLPYKDAFSPAISRSGNRLAYERAIYDPNIWRLSLSGSGTASAPPTRLIASTRFDQAAQYSPDGKRIAFESDRGGVHAIWICDADGSNAVELLPGESATSGTAHWSPDGKNIAFDFNPEGNMDIYVILASGGRPIRLTTDSADDNSPSWSRDGKWIYFGSNRTGRWEVWKVSVEGGKEVQVTRNGGETAIESPDGKFIYYTKEFARSSGLWKMPVSGGEEVQVLPSVFSRGFTLVNDGIYFIPEPGADGKGSLQFLSLGTGKVTTVAPMSGGPFEGLSVSPDSRFLLFSQFDEAGSDLMLVENFR